MICQPQILFTSKLTKTMDYTPPIQLSGYSIPVEIVEQPENQPELFVGYTLQNGDLTVGTNLPLTENINLYSVFMFDHGVDASAALTYDIIDTALIDVSAGAGVAWIDDELDPSLNINTALELAPSHVLRVDTFYNFDRAFTTVGYGYQF